MSLEIETIRKLTIRLLKLIYKVRLNEKVRNDTVGINEDFIQSVHHRPEHNDPID